MVNSYLLMVIERQIHHPGLHSPLTIPCSICVMHRLQGPKDGIRALAFLGIAGRMISVFDARKISSRLPLPLGLSKRSDN